MISNGGDPPAALRVTLENAPQSLFPIRVQYVSEATGAIAHEEILGGPGDGLEVPKIDEEYGRVFVRSITADGVATDHHWDDE